MIRHPLCRCDAPMPQWVCAALCERLRGKASHAERGAGVEGRGLGPTGAGWRSAHEATGAEPRPTAGGASCEVSGPASTSQGSAGGLASPAGGKPALTHGVASELPSRRGARLSTNARPNGLRRYSGFDSQLPERSGLGDRGYGSCARGDPAGRVEQTDSSPNWSRRADEGLSTPTPSDDRSNFDTRKRSGLNRYASDGGASGAQRSCARLPNLNYAAGEPRPAAAF